MTLILEKPVFLVEDHDEAYHLWKRHSIQGQILLHFDAHIDFEWIADKEPLATLQNKSLSEAFEEFKHSYGWALSDSINNFLHLGNYLCRGLQEGMFRQWYWIVPDSIWDDSQSRHQIWRDLLQYYKFRTGPMEYPRKEEHAFHASFFNVPFVVTSLRHLPKITEPVLLNIDVDYLTTERLDPIPPAETLRRRLPWIWPDEFAAHLNELGIDSVLTTLSNSVQGGFTPIQFKFFGQALQQLFSGQSLEEDYFQLKKAYQYYAQKQDLQASVLLNSFTSEGIYEATRFYRKAQLEFSQSAMQSAIALDPEFTSSYNNRGLYFEAMGRSEEALDEYQMIRLLLPNHIESRLGEADCWALQNRTNEARSVYFQVLQEVPAHEGAARRLGTLYYKEGNWPLAQQYLSIAATQNSRNIPLQLQLGKVFLKRGLLKEAKQCLRETLGMGGHVPACYFLLAETYWRLGFYRKATEFYLEGWNLRLKVKFRGLFS